jgi:hypothetical protein
MEIKLRLTNVDALVEWDRNPKDHDVDLIKGSLRLYGYVRPVMVNERIGKMLFGHGLTEALRQMREAGEDRPKRVQEGKGGAWVVPVLYCDLEEPLHEPYVVVDNRATEVGGWRVPVLIEALKTADDFGVLAETGFDSEDLENLMRKYEPPEDFPTADPSEPTNHECPRCGYEWN